MFYTIRDTKHRMVFVTEERKKISYTGYAFLDSFGHCVIIAYGESKRDDVERYLDDHG